MYQCICCGKTDFNAIEGLVIKKSYICFGCEKKIKDSKVDDDSYQFYMKGLKKIWRCLEL